MKTEPTQEDLQSPIFEAIWQGLINWAGFNIYKGVINKNKTSYEDLFYK